MIDYEQDAEEELDFIDELYNENFEMTHETKARVIKDHYIFIIEEVLCILNKEKGAMFQGFWICEDERVLDCCLEETMYNTSLFDIEYCFLVKNIKTQRDYCKRLNINKLAKIVELYDDLSEHTKREDLKGFIFGLDF